eukprot:15265545-Alexandrium_andersonii.AAC.1
MSASLVGSEMCIRDSLPASLPLTRSCTSRSMSATSIAPELLRYGTPTRSALCEPGRERHGT